MSPLWCVPRWTSMSSGHRAGSASSPTCSALVVGMDQLSSALTGQPESDKVPDSLQLQPLLQDLWQASEAEKDIPAAAKYWQASFPTASLLRARR
eukprot:g43992.t1